MKALTFNYGAYATVRMFESTGWAGCSWFVISALHVVFVSSAISAIAREWGRS